VRASLRRGLRRSRYWRSSGMLGSAAVALDVFPSSSHRRSISRPSPGIRPQQVEELVTKQVENAVNGAAGLATLRRTIPDSPWLRSHSRMASMCTSHGREFPSGCRSWAARYRWEWGREASPLVSSTMDLLKIGFFVRQGRCRIPCAIRRIGSSSRAAGRSGVAHVKCSAVPSAIQILPEFAAGELQCHPR